MIRRIFVPRLFVLWAATQAAIVTGDPRVALAQQAGSQTANAPAPKPSPPATTVSDPTMFALEGDGAGGPAAAPLKAEPASKPNAPVPSWRENGSWGWLVVVTSLGLGIATTAYGLTIRCADDATQCRKNTSLAIWGGVGLAAVGSAFGILIVQMGRARVQAKPAIFAGNLKPSREIGSGFVSGALIPGLILEGSFH